MAKISNKNFQTWYCMVVFIILWSSQGFTLVTGNTSSATVTDSTTASGPTNTLLPVTTEPSNATSVSTNGNKTTSANHPGEDSPFPQYVGFIIAAVAIVLYGSNYVPVKKFETGDGMFFQWIICAGTFLVGFVVQLIRNSKNFNPLVMIGGLFWATGNVCSVPIIKCIGLGLGLCIWAMTSLLSGWASSRFGWFGLAASTQIGNYVLNTIGVVVAASSSIIFAFVKNEVTPVDLEVEPPQNLLDVISNSTKQTEGSTGDSHSLDKNSTNQSHLDLNQRRFLESANTEPSKHDDSTFIDRLSPLRKRILGVVLSVFAGLLYGQMFTPAVYLQQQGDSKNALDYVFACFCGIFITSTVYFIIYIIFMKNKPIVYPKAIIPGLISGAMWATATAGWFVANQVLSPAIAFPIITTGPSVIASVWGVFVFKEIRGTRNITILILGFVFVFTGAILTAFSEKQ